MSVKSLLQNRITSYNVCYTKLLRHRAQWVKLSLGLITQFDFQDVAEDLVRARTGEFQAQAEFEKAAHVLNADKPPFDRQRLGQ